MVGVFGALFLFSLAFAQDNSTIRVETRLVQITAIVRDKHGAVADLTKNDFEIRDKGKARTIATFSVARAADHLARRALPPGTFSNRLDQKGDPPVTATVILFDQLNTPFPDQAYARKQAVEFLKAIDPQSPLAIYALGNNLRVVHDFTDDRERLARALGRYRNTNSTLLEMSDTAASAIEIEGTSLDQQTRNMGTDMLGQLLTPMQAFALDRRVSMTMSAMKVLALRLGGLQGRKNLVWISGAFPLGLAFDRGGLSGSGGQRVNYERDLKEAAQAIDRANVAIYPVDARGLLVNNSFRPSMPARISSPTTRPQNQRSVSSSPETSGRGETETMNLLADWTGGRAFYNTNDLRAALKQAADDSEVIYTLGFYVEEKDLDGSYHDIKVKTPKATEARYRRGYFATPLWPKSASSPGSVLAEASLGPADATGIGLTASLAPVSGQAGIYSLALHVDLDAVRLEEKNGKWVGGLILGFLQQAAEGKVLESTSKELQLNFTPERLQIGLQNGMDLRFNLRLGPDVAQLRTAVLDPASGNVGSLRIPGPK